MPPLWFADEAKTKSRVEPPYESVIIVTFAYDEGWTLKIGQIEEFVSSLTHE